MSRRRRLGLGGVLLASAGANILGLWWGLPRQTEAWAPDELSPWDVYEGARQGFSGGWVRPYPPLHYYVLTLVQLPVFFAVAAGWTSLTDSATYTALYLVIRLTSVVMAAATVALVYACGRELFDEASALASALLAALVAPFVYYAKVANVDGPATFWYVLALWWFVRALRRDRLRDVVGLGVAASCAIATKDQTFALFLPMPLALAVAEYRRMPTETRRPRWLAAVWNRRMAGAGVAAAVTFVALANPIFNGAGLVERARVLRDLPLGWEQVPPTVTGQVRLVGVGLRHLWFSLGTPSFLVGVAGVGLALRRARRDPWPLVLLLLVLSYWVGFVMPVRYVFDRYLLPVAVTLTFFGGHLLASLVRIPRLRPVGVAVAVGVLLYSAAYALSVDWQMLHDARYAAERWMVGHVPPGARVVVIGHKSYAPRLDAFDVHYVADPWAGVVLGLRADYVVVTSAYDERRFPDRPSALEFFSRLRSGELGYVPVARHRGSPPWNLVKFDGIETNLDKINPDVVVYAWRHARSVR